MTAEQEKYFRLLFRQLTDAQAQAERILNGDNSGSTIEMFARYVGELNHYIKEHNDDAGVASFLDEIPEIRYKRLQLAFWQYMVLPQWWLMVYRDYLARRQALFDVRTVREKYAILELRMRGLGFEN